MKKAKVMEPKQEFDGLDEREPRHDYDESEKVRQRDVDEEREEHAGKEIIPPESPDYLMDGVETKPDWEKKITVGTGMKKDGHDVRDQSPDPAKVPEEIPTLMEDMVDRVKDYVNIRTEIFLLKAVNKISMSGATTIAYVIFAFLFVLVMFLLSTGLALWVNEKMDSSYAGFLVVGGAYAVICVVLFLGKDKLLKKPFASIIIRAMLNE